MDLKDIQNKCSELLSRVEYPRVGTIIGLQEEIGKLAELIMKIEIYGKPFDSTTINKRCAEVFLSFIDLCNAYNVDLEKGSRDRINNVQKQIKRWEKEHGEILQEKKEKFN